MTHTVIGLFDSKQEATAAMQELVQQGFVKENIDVSNRRTGDTSAANTANTTQTNEGIGDSISNFFSSLFGEDETVSRNYSDVANETEAILSVQVDSSERAKEAAKILDQNGAINVDDRAEQYRQNYAQGSGQTQNQTTQNRSTQNRGTTGSETSIPVMEENLQVGKQARETGGVRVHSRIVEKPVEETLRLREEHVVVNRNPVNREATEADLQNMKEGDIEITEHAEVPVVSKQARVVEEISVGKTVEEHDKTVRDTVRKTEVDIEKIDGETDNQTARRASNR